VEKVKQYREKLRKLGQGGELIIPLIALVGSIPLFYLATKFEVPFGMGHVVGPDLFPKVLLGLIMALSMKLIYDAVKKGAKTEFEEVLNPQNLWVTLGFFFGYVVLLEIVGFVVLTPIWIAAYMYTIGLRRWQWLVGGTCVLSLFLIFVFPVLMLVPLPRGIGIFRMISLLFY
jgi:hypothetical protein